MDHLDLDTLIAHITSTNSPRQLNDFLKNIPSETREVLLASTYSSGQDPLNILNVRNNSLGILYMLSARVTVHGATPPPWQIVDNFCHNFDQHQVRYAPERLIVLGKALPRLAVHYNNQNAAIVPFRALIQRYVPDPSYLTSLHPQFIIQCVSARRFTDALPILTTPVTNIDNTDMHYTDNLVYHYVGGIALAALKMWSLAQDFFETCVTSPGLVPSAIQFEALKKMRLVQLIDKGRVEPLPKYALPNLTRLIKNSPYQGFVNAYPHDVEGLKEIVKKEKQVFMTDRNFGLVQQAIERAPRWTIKKLIGTYVTLNLTDIARAVKIESLDQVREILLNMIESNEISARIAADGTVTFSDPSSTITKSQVDAILRQIQVQSLVLTKLDLELGKSRDYLAKAVKLRDDWSGAGAAANAAEELLMGGAVGGVGEGVWEGEGGFGS